MPDDHNWIDELYAEGSGEAPPGHLDRAIRSAAREAVSRPWYRQPATLTNLAMAASVVLAAMIIYYAPLSEEAGLTPPAAPAPAAVFDGPAQDVAAQRPALKSEAGFTDKPEAATPASAGRRTSLPPSVSAGAQPAQTAAEPEAESRFEEIIVTASAPDPAGRGAGMSFEAVAPASLVEMPVTPVTPEQILEELEEYCGPAPGLVDGRRLVSDSEDWYLEVRSPAGILYWRCVNGAWAESAAP